MASVLEPLAQARGLISTDPFNLGEASDYRLPDGALGRPNPDAVYLPTAAPVIEVVSPDDDTWEKLPFYAKHGVDELLIVDPQKRRVDWLALSADGEYAPVKRSSLIELGPEQLAQRIDWPR